MPDRFGGIVAGEDQTDRFGGIIGTEKKQSPSYTKDIIKQAALGPAEAAMETSRAMESLVPLPAVKKERFGMFSPSFYRLRNVVEKGLEERKPETAAGAFARGTSKFLTGFAGGKKLLGAVGLKNAFIKAIGAGAIADFSVFDPHEQRLSNLIQSVPALQNPVTEYLQADKDDTELEGRIKQVLEGAGLGGAIDGVLRGIRMVKGARQARKTAEQEVKQTAEQAQKQAAKQESVIALDTDIEAAKKAGKVSGADIGPEALTREATETKLAGTDIAPTLAHMNTPQEIKDVLANTVKATEPAVEAARRGRVSWQQTEDLAGKLATTPEKLMNRKLGQAMNAEQLEAMRSVMTTASTELHAAAKRAYSGTDIDKLAFIRLRDNYFNVVNQFMGARAEAGRALNILRKNNPSSRQMKEFIDNIGGVKNIDEQARLIAELDTPEQIAKAVSLQRKSKISDVLMETWINALLSGPQTHVVNMTSNSLVSMWRMPEHMLTATYGKLFRSKDKAYFRESLGNLYGYAQGAKEGVRTGWQAFWNEAPSDLMSKIELPRDKAISASGLRAKGVTGKSLDVLGKFVRVPGRALMAEDEFFKAMNYRMSLNSTAMRQGINKGLKGRELAEHVRKVVDNPDDALREAALDDARYYTFTKSLGKTGIALQQFANSHPAFRVIMPFIRTPTNIVKFAGERSPFALFSKGVRDEIMKGGLARDQALAKITMGTTVASAIAAYAAEGNITGGGPVDPAARQALYRTGWQPYSLKIGDKYHSYARLEPLGIIFGVTADMAEIAGQMEEADAAKVAAMISASISKNMVSKTWLQGLSNALQAVEDPDRYAETFVRNLAGTVVPTGVAQYARAKDPVLRETRTVLDRIRSRIPGYREDLPARLNLWGEPIILEGGLGPDMVSPIYQSTKKMDKVNDEIVRLDLNPSMPRRKLAGVELTPQQYNEYVKLAGEQTKSILDRIVDTPSWKRLPDYEKRNLIENTINANRQMAGNIMASKYPELLIEQPIQEKILEMQK